MSDATLAALYPHSEDPEWTHRYRGTQGRIEAALYGTNRRDGTLLEEYACVAQMTAGGAEFYVARRDTTGYLRCRDEATETVRRSQ